MSTKLGELQCHWSCLVSFSNLVLNNPKNIEQEFGDEALVRKSLINCLDFIDPEIPNLDKLGRLQCDSQSLYSERILFAACLEIMREKGNLEVVDLRHLKALRTNINMNYRAVSDEDQDALQVEVDRLIFSDSKSVENFLRQYLEPQLAQNGCTHPEIWLLRNDKVFSHLRSTLSIDWIGRFTDLALNPLIELFDIAAQYGSREDLNEIIAERCAEFMTNWPEPT